MDFAICTLLHQAFVILHHDGDKIPFSDHKAAEYFSAGIQLCSKKNIHREGNALCQYDVQKLSITCIQSNETAVIRKQFAYFRTAFLLLRDTRHRTTGVFYEMKSNSVSSFDVKKQICCT